MCKGDTGDQKEKKGYLIFVIEKYHCGCIRPLCIDRGNKFDVKSGGLDIISMYTKRRVYENTVYHGSFP
uniref:Uncharacterized protein n=1 Tax=Romanomermis culicivorax TaxID=13658 RepID=A0A915KSN6_ROMCU